VYTLKVFLVSKKKKKVSGGAVEFMKSLNSQNYKKKMHKVDMPSLFETEAKDNRQSNSAMCMIACLNIL